MAKGEIYPSEYLTFRDSQTGVEIRQVTIDFRRITTHSLSFLPMMTR